MSIELVPVRTEHAALLRTLSSTPELSTEFEHYRSPDGIESALADPFLLREGSHVALLDGEPAGDDGSPRRPRDGVSLPSPRPIATR